MTYIYHFTLSFLAIQNLVIQNLDLLHKRLSMQKTLSVVDLHQYSQTKKLVEKTKQVHSHHIRISSLISSTQSAPAWM